MSYKIAMLGAGSFFADAVAEGLCESEIFEGSTFVLMDIDAKRLRLSEARNKQIVKKLGGKITISATRDRRRALDGCDYVVTSCEKSHIPYWIKDIEIPARYGVRQFMGENGGPGGQAHAMRNITMFTDICKDMRALCPQAWLMNFTNPMSFVCTYLHRHGGIKALGFCHQVHGSFGVVAEMLGMEPGDLEVISGGVNHFNWLLDVRRKGSQESYMDEFLAKVKKSKYWKKIHSKIPKQKFTLDILNTFGLYAIGYDDHICEYTPFFYDSTEWKKMGYHPLIESLREGTKQSKWKGKASEKALQVEESRARAEFYNVPFPKDGHHLYYRESPTLVMEAFKTNTPLHLTSIVIPNHGAIANLPADAIVDVPAIVDNSGANGIHVGPLPTFAMELCRRQVTIHELVVEATVNGDRRLAVQAMALDPYVTHIRQAEKIVDAFLKYYREDLPQF